MALPVLTEVDASDDFSGAVALPENDAYVLVVVRISFYRIRGAWLAFNVAFAVIDLAVLHNILYFQLGYFPAFHAATGVVGILQVRNPAVEPVVAVHLLA